MGKDKNTIFKDQKASDGQTGKEKNKSKSKNWWKFWKGKKRNVNKKKDKKKEKDGVQLIEFHSLTAQYTAKPVKNSLGHHEVENLGRQPLTAKGKLKNKPQDHCDSKQSSLVQHEKELSGNQRLTAKHATEVANKSQIRQNKSTVTVQDVKQLSESQLAATKYTMKIEVKSKHMCQSASPNNIVGHYNQNVSDSGYKQKVNIIKDRTSTSIPNGLPNLGNTCYFNATLQCLFWCKGFHTLMNTRPMGTVSEKLMEVFQYMNGNGDKDINRQKSILCGLGSQSNTGREVVKQLLNAIRKRNNQFDGYDQQDSFEMLNTILNSIQEEYKMHKTTLSAQKSLAVNMPRNTSTEKDIRISPVDEEFGGTFVTTYVHDHCKEVDLVFQNFTTISIPVMQSKTTSTHQIAVLGQGTNIGQTRLQVDVESVQAAALCMSTSRCGNTGVIRGLREVTSMETMDANILPCRKCNDNAVGSLLKRSSIISIPKILILHISRFSQCGWNLHKDQRLVSYPYYLNISDVCSSAIEMFGIGVTSLKYELCGVVCHSGTMNSGHYIAYVNTSLYEGTPTVKYNPKDKSKDIEEFLSRKIKNSSPDHGYSHNPGSSNDTNHTCRTLGMSKSREKDRDGASASVPRQLSEDNFTEEENTLIQRLLK